MLFRKLLRQTFSQVYRHVNVHSIKDGSKIIETNRLSPVSIHNSKRIRLRELSAHALNQLFETWRFKSNNIALLVIAYESGLTRFRLGY